jgi:hypothetical protein
VIVNVAAAEVPPPGAGLTTVTLAMPVAAMSVVRIVAVSCVGETNVVARTAPFQFTVEVLTKLLPLTLSVAAGPPAVAPDGLMLPRTGTRLSTVVVAVALLLPAAASHEEEATPAVLLKTPPTVGVTVKVTVAVARLARAPRVQVTVLVPLHVPWLGVTETKLTPLGSGSVTDTSVAPPGPLFVTVMV